METTLLGVIEVNPRQILNDGVRKHLVRQVRGVPSLPCVARTGLFALHCPSLSCDARGLQIAHALHKYLLFDLKGSKKDPKVC